MSDGQDLKNAPGISANHQNGSWRAVITLLIIVGVIVIGAFYMWGERISEERERPGYPAEGNAAPQT